MRMLETCEECGVPRIITKEYLWLNNGDIVQKRNQRHRIIFTECENWDPLFKGIGDIIGSPIEHMVITCVRRGMLRYLRTFLPADIAEEVRKGNVDPKSIDDSFRELGPPMGSGVFEFVDMRHEGDRDDFFTVSVARPYSLLMCAATHSAAMEAIFGYPHEVTYSEEAPGVYYLRAFPSEHLEELKGRMAQDFYEHCDGDVELERCGTCGGPRALSVLSWDMERGVITDSVSKRRIAVMSPTQIEPVFNELEMELGETIPRVVVEAQRRFTRTGFYSMDDYKDAEEFREGLAMRGIGNLQELKISRQSLSMRLGNAVLPMMVVGMMQGIFDNAMGVDSVADWQLSPQGDLELMITALPK
jgi:hypothetical protein